MDDRLLYQTKNFRRVEHKDKENLYRNKYSDISFSYLNHVAVKIKIRIVDDDKWLEAYDLALEFIDNYFTEHQLDHLILEFNKHDLIHLLSPYYLEQFQKTRTTSLSRYGFIPHNFFDRVDVSDLLRYYREPENLKWETFSDWIMGNSLPIFDKYSIRKLKEILETRGKSEIIFWLYPEKIDNFLYKSGRPKTTLSHLRINKKELEKNLILTNVFISGIELFVSKSQNNFDNSTQHDNINYYIPITRYGEGMSGLYYTDVERPDYICGIFYYYEPDSDYLLAVNKNKILISDNKYSAAKNFINNSDDDKLQLKLNTLINNINSTIINENDKTGDFEFEAFLIENKIADKFMTGRDVGDYQGLPVMSSKNDFRLADGKYADYIRDFYALEDSLDQPLCKAAKNNNIDVIILTKMVGAGSELYDDKTVSTNRLVIEVLDTRDKNISYNSLYHINK